MTSDRVLHALLAAAQGEFPPVDGAVRFLPPPSDGLEAVVSFTGHTLLATALTEADFGDLALDGFGAALQPPVLLRLAGPAGRVGVLDATLVGRGLGGGRLPARTDLDGHPRVQYALDLRRRVRVYGDERGLVTLADGLCGRLEMSVEVASARLGTGVGGSLIREGLRRAPEGQPVFAAVSPGNVRSLRAFLTVGFQPIGSEVIIRPDRNRSRPRFTDRAGSRC